MTQVTKTVRETRARGKFLKLICKNYKVTLLELPLSMGEEEAHARVDRFLVNHPELLLV